MAGIAVRKAHGGGESHAPKPRGNGADGHVPTVREFLPWHVIEKKMTSREDGLAVEDAPNSGVYTSEQHQAANECDGAPVDPSALSYKVYTLEELEARGIQADTSVSSTRMSIAIMAQKQTPWADTGHAALVVLRMAKTWAQAASPRPPIADVLRAPFVAFVFELRAALRQVEWRKVGMGAGLAFGTFFLLLFAVLTAADLTDDLRPARSARGAAEPSAPWERTSGDSYTSAIVAAAHPKPVPRPVPTAEAVDLDAPDSELAPAPPAPRAHGQNNQKKNQKKNRARRSEVFIP